MKGEGIVRIWDVIKNFKKKTKESGVFDERRNRQTVDWVFTMIEEYLKESFYRNPRVNEEIPGIKEQLLKKEVLPTTAAEKLLQFFYSSRK